MILISHSFKYLDYEYKLPLVKPITRPPFYLGFLKRVFRDLKYCILMKVVLFSFYTFASSVVSKQFIYLIATLHKTATRTFGKQLDKVEQQ